MTNHDQPALIDFMVDKSMKLMHYQDDLIICTQVLPRPVLISKMIHLALVCLPHNR